jgi:hypothetical protein
MIETITNENEIENLYKTGSHAPYTKLEKGNFGYLGVLCPTKIQARFSAMCAEDGINF